MLFSLQIKRINVKVNNMAQSRGVIKVILMSAYLRN